MKNAVFWDVTPCGCCKNCITTFTALKRITELGKTLAVTSDNLFRSNKSRTVSHHRRRHLHSHRRENLKSYIALTGFAL
jgi:hypothetical protein